MKPDPAAPAEMLNLLRQQLILAQVRIMELEDSRDELAPKLAETEQLLTEAQSLADRKVDEAAHLERVRSTLQAEYEHMRHMQHVTNEALNAARAEATALAAREKNLLQELTQLELLARQLADSGKRQLADIASLQTGVDVARSEIAKQAAIITRLDEEQRALKASRSWRWTAWLRSLERILSRSP